jgi:hypothetical protein
MKNLFVLLLLIANVAFAGNQTEMYVPTDDIYVPKGFDSNDNVEVVVTGFLPDLCYHSPQAKVIKTEGKNIIIEVKALYKTDMNGACPEVIVPFTETVEVGVLDKGDYNLIVNQGQPTSLNTPLAVGDSFSPYIDDFVYLSVDYVKKDYKNRIVTIHGWNPSDCFVLDQVKIISNDKDTLSLLPILKQVRDFCPMKMTPLNVEVEIPNILEKQKILLHVRSMEGKAYNTIFMNIAK